MSMNLCIIVLARISHKLSTAEPQGRALPALHSIWVLNILQVCFRAQTFARLVTTHPCGPRYESCEKSGASNGRNASHEAPPVEIRTCGVTAYGSCLG